MKKFYTNLVCKSTLSVCDLSVINSLSSKRRPILQTLTVLFSCLLFSSALYGQQVPESFSYQAVVRDLNNDPFMGVTLGVQITILQGSPSGAEVFKETHSPVSNDVGLITLKIGTGNNITGSITAINWEMGPYYVRQEIDPANGTNYTISSTTQLLSVPYALYSKKSGRANIADVAETANSISSSAAGELTVPIGTILPYAGPAGNVPSGWLLCDGASYQTTAYPELFTLIGTSYGSEPGRFKVPNLLGRVPAGYDNSQTEFNALGKAGGAKTHTLTENELPSHNHTASTNFTGSHQHRALVDSGGGGAYGTDPGGGGEMWTDDDGGSAMSTNNPIANGFLPTNFAGGHSHTVTVGNTGGGQGHNNLPPYLSVNYIIKVR